MKREDSLLLQYHNLEDIKREFLKYAPAYAQEEAAQAIDKIIDLQAQGVIRCGVYYIVLVDLVGSTAFAAEHGNDALANRIKLFVQAGFGALNHVRLRNVALFVKEIGDAVLFVFHHFPDFLRWHAELTLSLSINLFDLPPFVLRTCVHVGEVHLEGVNPLSIAVSQTFKMEKASVDDSITLSEPAFHIAWPTVARAYHGFRRLGEIDLEGYTGKLGLFELVLEDEHDSFRIAEEGLE